MKPSRHQAREVALQILYRYDIDHAGAAPVELIDELNGHFDHFKVPDELRGFAAELVAGSVRERAQLDELIEAHASNWKITRMSYVDRNLLRMAICELRRFPDTPPSVVIDEAIELAKQFGTAESPAFINGILDAVKGALARA